MTLYVGRSEVCGRLCIGGAGEEGTVLSVSCCRGASRVVTRCAYSRGSLVPVVRKVRRRCHCLPPRLLACITRGLKVSRTGTCDITDFCRGFSFRTGKGCIVGMYSKATYRIHGSVPVLRKLCGRLKLKGGGRAASSRLFAMRAISYLNTYKLTPTIVIGSRMRPGVAPRGVDRLVGGLQRRRR